MSAAVARRYFVRGREQLRRGDFDSAVQEFGAAVELHPTYVEARVGYALTLARTDPPRAANSLRAGLQRATRATERAPLLCALGDVLLIGGDFRGAESAYTEAAALPNASRKLHDRLARLRAKTGQYAEALSEMLLAARGR
jgi:Flp pilus assembly protein TadD